MARQLSGTPGSIDKKTFKEGVSSLAFEDDAFVDRVFKLLDVDHGGTIDWEEFVQTVNALETGSPHDKLAFCFQVPKSDPKPDPNPDPNPDPDLSLTLTLTLSLTLTLTLAPTLNPDPDPKLAFYVQVYDADGNNSIERVELHRMFTSMLSAGMTNDEADMSMSDELKDLIDDFVNSIYDSIDCDRSGSLEFDEVAEVIEKHKITDVWEIFGRTLVSSVA